MQKPRLLHLVAKRAQLCTTFSDTTHRDLSNPNAIFQEGAANLWTVMRIVGMTVVVESDALHRPIYKYGCFCTTLDVTATQRDPSNASIEGSMFSCMSHNLLSLNTIITENHHRSPQCECSQDRIIRKYMG